MMVAEGVRADDGVKLSEMSSATAVFKSYPMMKVAGLTLYEYNFPACFLYPFIGEAIFTIFLPLHFGKQLVRTRELPRETVESYLQPLPMDLARYGDIIVNIILCTFCFFTTSGWVLWTLLGLLLGHCFIYAFDHYRTLRHMESFYLTSSSIDAAACGLLVIPCGVLASAVLFQLHDIGLVRGNLWLYLGIGFALHAIVHSLLLIVALRLFSSRTEVQHEKPYVEVAVMTPGNWFNDNPVHCVRSKFLHHQAKPCVYYVKGKENLVHRDERLLTAKPHEERLLTGDSSNAKPSQEKS
jgi:hypothetical protein